MSGAMDIEQVVRLVNDPRRAPYITVEITADPSDALPVYRATVMDKDRKLLFYEVHRDITALFVRIDNKLRTMGM